MKGGTPPSGALLLASAVLVFFTIPWLPLSGRVGPMPTWAFVTFFFVVVCSIVNFLTLSSWRPADEKAGGLVAEMVES